MVLENAAEEAQILLRNRISNPSVVFSFITESPDSNYRKLKHIISSSVTEACSNSALLLGPRGCGKIEILQIVLDELLKEFPDMISVIKLNGLLHGDSKCAMKEIARQLCVEHQLLFSRMASYDDNSQFLMSMLRRECGLAHKTIVFVLEEFDLFTQGKQQLLYSLLDALQSVTSQAVVIGISCRLDADQLLEKRVRSRFSHRKLLFPPPSSEELQRVIEHILKLPTESSLPNDYTVAYNAKLLSILEGSKFKSIVEALSYSDSTISHLLKFLFCAVSHIDLRTGFLSLENFKTALQKVQRQPKLEFLKDCSVLELYIVVCMKRMELKEVETCNFNSIMKEYKTVHDTFQTTDYYARNVCLRAFQHLVDRQLVSFEDGKGHGQSIEFRPVKLLVSRHELQLALKSHASCP
ncbi:hypothetical protein M569_02708, partial [Genlisea aurea]